MGIYIKLNSAKTLDIYDNGYILGRAIPANVGTARLCINNSNSKYSFGFTSNSSASQYSPAFKINGKDCYIARAEAYTSSRSSQYISGYGTKQEVDYYGTASRSSTSGYGTKKEVDYYGTASRSSTSGYGTASRSSISAYSTRAYYKYGSNSTNAGYIHNIATVHKTTASNGEFYTYSFKVKATYEGNTLYSNTFYARTMISATAEAQNDSYGGLFSGTCVTSYSPTSTKMFFRISVTDNKYSSYYHSEGELFHVIYCDLDAYDTNYAARSIGMTMTTRTVQEAQTRSSQYTSTTYTRSSQYTSNTYYKTVTTATYTRSSQYTSNTYYKTVTTATYTASRSSQYNTSSHNVNM